MHKTIDLPAAGYTFIPGVFQYSAGVAALPGHHLRRVQFAKPGPVREGFDRIADYSFAYATHGDSNARSFVIAGSAEAPEGKENYRDHVSTW